jgi:hypothetical protein
MLVLLRQPIIGLTPNHEDQMTICLEMTVDLPGLPCPGLEIRGLRVTEKTVTVEQSEYDLRLMQCRCTLKPVGSMYVPARDTRSDFGSKWQGGE